MVELQAWISDRIKATPEQIAEYCDRWKITEFALFGSVLRDDFRPDSDIDVLVTFAPDRSLTLDSYLKMQEEIEVLFSRKVDLVQKQYLKNPFRRHEILKTQQVIYAIRES
ncbi:nucleotidyltransferase family protein [Leptolyngbya sp. AN03gr2]|uniref:nucleotidyltransferase family protein n=1 Tax=unclassified Leptolyngbya TaxID=2650499 RepID=UPI003D3223DC